MNVEGTGTAGRRTRLLIVGHEVVGPKMAGPGLRHWELARVLSRELEVTVAAPGIPAREPEGFRLIGYRRADAASLAGPLEAADVVLTFPHLLRELPLLATAGKPLVLDLYIPYTLESLQHWEAAARPIPEQQRELDRLNAELAGQLRVGDFFLAGSERQRHFWLGMLTVAGRVNAVTCSDDPTLRRLVDVMPLGLPAEPPQHRRRVLKGASPGIGDQDRVLLWGSGIWNWFDPVTLLRALARLVPHRPEIKAFFVSRSHFDKRVMPDQARAHEAVTVARDLGLLNTHVFFGGWVPYDERENYLLEADLGVSLQFEHVESHFAIRTRLLDFIWAGLPMVVTRGDVLGDLAAREGLARALAPQDVDGAAAAIAELLDEPDLKVRSAPAFERVRAQFTWERVAEPLLAFCRAPRRAPDAALQAARTGTGYVPIVPPLWRLPQRAVEYLRAGGVGYFRQGVALYARWLRAGIAARFARKERGGER